MQPDSSDATWRTSSFSGNGASCVEVKITPSVIMVRDTKNRAAATLAFRPDEWEAFLAGVRHGEFNLPTTHDH
ncbi:DUF397 domain-containing protein [Nonomuraea sp. 10N515B]|uniref:DUF397 domain-containing protein n=1 Tax=Nonomuraea sp. 10N515B TaxID=3457422 RepID=UPI003FCC7FA9